jgi:hypothetical protein
MGRQQAAGLAHPSPVILIRRSARQADLIMAAIVIGPRPGKTMRATLPQEKSQQIHNFTA